MRSRNLLLLPALLVLLACGEDPTGGDGSAVSRIEISPEAPLLEAIGAVVPMQARVIRRDGSVVAGAEIGWTSSDPGIAGIDKGGLVTAIADGQTVITAEYAKIAVSTTISVRQRVAGLRFGTGPRDGVVGGSHGDVTVIVHDPLGSAVASASGAATLSMVPGSPGMLAGGPRTVTLQSGQARFADVRVTGEGEGYRVEAVWGPYVATSLPFAVVPGLDVVRLENAPAGERGFLLDGFGSGRFLNDEAVRGSGETVPVGIFRSMPGGNDEILVFGPARRPAMLRPAPWTAGIDTLSVALEAPIALDVTLWIVKGPFDAQAARARAAMDTTAAIWTDQNAGLVFDSVEYVDATNDPDAARYFDLTLCNSQSGLESQIGKRAGRINVYYVGTVDGGSARGRACPIGGDHAIMAASSGHELLSHEIGHLLSLTHTDGIAAFDQTNVMHSASDVRRYLTEGQSFRQQFDTNSVLNRLFGLRTGQARACPLATTDALCPAIETRIWADGAFPASTGADRPVPLVAAGAPGLPTAPRDVVERWIATDCEMDGNAGLSERVRELGDEGVREFVRAFMTGPSANVDGRRAALDGLTMLATPAATGALEALASQVTGDLRAEVLDRLQRTRPPIR